MKPTQQYLGLREAAAYLGRSERAMYHLVARRAVPFRRHGSRLVFCRAELEEWLHGMPGVSVKDALAHTEELSRAQRWRRPSGQAGAQDSGAQGAQIEVLTVMIIPHAPLWLQPIVGTMRLWSLASPTPRRLMTAAIRWGRLRHV